jgi:hypothetical protein
MTEAELLIVSKFPHRCGEKLLDTLPPPSVSGQSGFAASELTPLNSLISMPQTALAGRGSGGSLVCEHRLLLSVPSVTPAQ